MRMNIFCWTGVAVLLLSGCTNLEDVDVYPELIDGNWRLADVEFAVVQDRDSCSFDGVMTFLPDGDYEKVPVACTNGQSIESPIEGSWKFKDDGEILYVKERMRIENSVVISYRNFSYVLTGDSLFLSEDLETGIDRFTYVRE